MHYNHCKGRDCVEDQPLLHDVATRTPGECVATVRAGSLSIQLLQQVAPACHPPRRGQLPLLPALLRGQSTGPRR